MLNFRNDYCFIAHKKILDDLYKYNDSIFVGYGEDEITYELNLLVRKKCDKDVDTYILAGGTITNIIGLSKMLNNPYDAVIALKTAHINVHETGAIESSGHKIILVNSNNGKMHPKDIEIELNKFVDYHMVKPKVIYISNSTELGETYTLEELKDLYKYAKDNNLYLFIDGARLAQAIAANNYSLKDIASLCDMFYIGGTKIGLPYGELLIITNNELKKDFKYLLKNKLGLLSKSFVPAIMFKSLIEDDLYIKLAKEAQDRANDIRNKLEKYVIYPNNTNQVFLKLDNSIVTKLSKKVDFELWESAKDYSVIRLVTTYRTTKEDIEELIKLIN